MRRQFTLIAVCTMISSSYPIASFAQKNEAPIQRLQRISDDQDARRNPLCKGNAGPETCCSWAKDKTCTGHCDGNGGCN